jgi:hypothetical protein
MMAAPVAIVWSGLGELRLHASPRPLVLGEHAPGVDPCDSVSLLDLGQFHPALEDGAAAGAFQVYERITDLPWLRERLERDRTSANFQGNPLWPLQVLAGHPALAGWFGLNGAADDFRCCVPGGRAVTHRLARLCEAGLGTTWSFAPYGDGEPFSDRKYLHAFLHDRTLPCAPEHSRDFVHDWSYHFISLLLPDFLENIRLNLEILLRLAATVRLPTRVRWGIYGHSEDADGLLLTRFIEEALPYDEAIARRIATEVDVLTARPVQALLASIEGKEARAVAISQPCVLYLGPPTQASLRHLLPELEAVLGEGLAGLPDRPRCETAFVTHAWRCLSAMEATLAGLSQPGPCCVPSGTMPRVLTHLNGLRRLRSTLSSSLSVLQPSSAPSPMSRQP